MWPTAESVQRSVLTSLRRTAAARLRAYVSRVRDDGDPWAAAGAGLIGAGVGLYVTGDWQGIGRLLSPLVVLVAAGAALGSLELASLSRSVWAAVRAVMHALAPDWKVLTPAKGAFVPLRVGAVVWTWVPFEVPDASGAKGKDRPMVILGRDGSRFYGVALTSRDHTHRDDVVRVGVGDWDPQRRVSYANVGRVLRVSPQAIRRPGGEGLDDGQLAVVRAAAERIHGPGAFGSPFTAGDLPLRALRRRRSFTVVASGYVAAAVVVWRLGIVPMIEIVGLR